MCKWIVYKADTNQPHWKGRKLQHTQALTKILQENWDSTDRPIPQAGDRFTEYVQVSSEHDPNIHGYSTHYKQGDWEVVRVETYTTELESSSFGMIVICYCQYNPMDAPLSPMPPRNVFVDSFGGDKKKYQEWLEKLEVKS